MRVYLGLHAGDNERGACVRVRFQSMRAAPASRDRAPHSIKKRQQQKTKRKNRPRY